MFEVAIRLARKKCTFSDSIYDKKLQVKKNNHCDNFLNCITELKLHHTLKFMQIYILDPLSPHDALNHHFASLKLTEVLKPMGTKTF